MNRRLFMLALMGACASQARADSIEDIRQKLVNVPVLRGQFAQEKQVSGFRNPLRSQGRFVLARDRGVIWSTERPFASEIVITSTQIRTRRADGGQQTEVDSATQPGLRVVNSLLFSVLSGNLATLSEYFSMQAVSLPAGNWELTLDPKEGVLGRVLKRVFIAGDRFVRHVKIDEQNGDQIDIVLSNLEPGASGLTRDELTRFD